MDEASIIKAKIRDEAAKRKNILYMLAQGVAQNQERSRQKAIKDGTMKVCVPSNNWKTGAGHDAYQAEQLAYTIPYKAEFETKTNSTTSSIHEAADHNDDDRATSRASVYGSCAVSTIDENDTVPRLPSIRGRRGRLRTGPGSSLGTSSVANFERTSTVLAVDGALEEYTSNICLNEIRRDFFSDYKTNTQLPIYQYRSNVINSINSYGVVIIEGATGCGKTTQVPTYILEDVILEKQSSKAPIIYVTQPRRIAAKSIAQRVCDEHGWELGDLVGYQVALDRKAGPRTLLMFVTAGVLLQKLIQDKSLKNYSHIIIDEAHERDADTDLLLMMIRTLMRREMSFFRLIVMSATMDMQKIKSYFTFRTSYGHHALTTPSICKIGQDKKPTDVQIIYFDKLRSTFQVPHPMPEFDIEVPELHAGCVEAAAKIIIDVIPCLDTFNDATKSTLVFLPGLAEIQRLERELNKRLMAQDMGDGHIEIIALHSCLPVQHQIRVFQPSKHGYRKVILATNIAESSITVKDVGFIVDFCLTKALRKDEITRFPVLKLQWSTADKCIQRAGRTGRCCPGKVFRMVSSNFYKAFDRFAQPELLTMPLELSVLRVKNFQMGEIKALFAVVLDPPPLNEIRTAVLELKQIGALSSTYEGKLSDIDGDLTELGRVISALPIDVHLSKLIVLASIFDVLEDAIIVAACLSTNRTVVVQEYDQDKELDNYIKKLEWAHGSESDLIVCLDVYKEFIRYKEEQSKDNKWLENFCRESNLDDRKLHEVSALVEEIKLRLEQLNVKGFDQPNRQRDQFEDELMLKIAFCGSFYPNYFLSEEMDVKDIRKSLCGLDATKTLILHNIPINQVPLHKSTIECQLRRAKMTADIDYIADFSRAYLVVNDEEKKKKDTNMIAALEKGVIQEQTSEISLSVYKGLRLADCNRLLVREYKDDAASERMLYYKEERAKLERLAPGRLLPPLMKLVNGEPDNRRLFELEANEYSSFTTRNYYLEVKFNQKQDDKDMDELTMLENKEHKELKFNRCENSNASLSHHIFKEYKYITGPTSPIQMSFRSVLEKSRGFNVNIDKYSVNSIILNPDIENQRRQLLVAASVRQSKNSRIMANDTTLMPNIRGLATLMALLFGQYYRVVFNEQLKCLSGAIFGLGWDENDKPISADYQVELGFDIHLSHNDIELINKARSIISDLVKFVGQVQNPGAPRAEVQQRLRKIMLLIIQKKRYPLSEVVLSNVFYTDKEFTLDKHNVPQSQFVKLEEGENRVFLPVMESTKIFKDWDMFSAVRKNLDFLESIQDQKARVPMGGVRCLLCGGGVEYLFIMRHELDAHMYTESHINNFREFEKFEESARPSFEETESEYSTNDRCSSSPSAGQASVVAP